MPCTVFGASHTSKPLCSAFLTPWEELAISSYFPQRSTLCVCYKNYSTLFHFNYVSHPQNDLCFRPCHSSSVLHQPSTISEAQQVPASVQNSFNGCLLNSCRNDLTPTPKLPGANVLILFLIIPPLEKLMNAMHLYQRKIQQPIKFYIIL